MNTAMITSRRARRNPNPNPKRLSKAGEFMKQHPGGIVVINDYRAVCQ